MELDEFVEELSGKPLTEQQQQLLSQMAETYTGRRPRVAFLGTRFNPVFAIGNLIHEDFNRLEERVLATLLSDDKQQRQIEKTILFGHRFTYGWFDEFESMIKTRNVPMREVFNLTEPADHPTRKREPKGPRGKWGKLK